MSGKQHVTIPRRIAYKISYAIFNKPLRALLTKSATSGATKISQDIGHNDYPLYRQ